MGDITAEDYVVKRFVAQEETSFQPTLSAFNRLVDAKSTEESEKELQSFLLLLHSYQQSIEQLKHVEAVGAREVANYRSTQASIEGEISGLRREIAELKQQLERERELRRQKEEYEQVCRQINQYKSREVQQQSIDALSDEHRRLCAERDDIKAEMDLKGKQFLLFFHALGQLRTDFDASAAELNTGAAASASASSSSSSSSPSNATATATTDAAAPASTETEPEAGSTAAAAAAGPAPMDTQA